MRAGSRRRIAGSSFIELLFAIAMVSVSVTLLVQQVAISVREVNEDAELQFAYGKAIGLLAELQSDIDQRRITTLADLDAMARPVLDPFLTTRPVASPADIMSGNSKTAQGEWRWYRTIELEVIPGVDRSRYARIELHRMNDRGTVLVAGGTAGIVSVPVTHNPSVKNYDVYVLALAEAPSLWMPLPALRAQLQTTASSIESANPNVRFRLHWISKMGYGRNELYVPYVNQQTAADAAAPWAYWYPGKLAAGNGASTLYAAELFSGRVRTETGVLNGYDVEVNPFPHAVADRFNHCMREPEARALFEQRVLAGLENEDEPPLQLLLADMAADPTRFKNALIINLHGEGLPFPPVRNYSDPAVREDMPDVRVATHTRRLHTIRQGGGNPVEFRVHAYKTDPTAGALVLGEPIVLEIAGGDFSGDLVVDNQTGGVHPDTGAAGTPAGGKYGFGTALSSAAAARAYEMYYEVGYSAVPTPHTFIKLYNTPLACPDVGAEGMASNSWLYGTDYVPSPVWNTGGYMNLLNEASPSQPKNTMRWRIRIPQTALEREMPNASVITGTTRIGTDATTGRVWPTPNQPENVTITYAWWSTDPNDVPITERYQFLGDPRHNPYIDNTQLGTAFKNGHNWWFDDLESPANGNMQGVWPSLDGSRLADGLNGVIEDAPRMLQVWRDVLQQTGAVFINPGGRLAGRLLLGGEIALPGGTDAVNPVLVHGDFYGAASPVAVDDISSPSTFGASERFGRPVLVDSTSPFWVKPWMAELFRPSDLLAFRADGNLRTSSGIHREVRCTTSLSGLPMGTSFEQPSGSTLGDAGAASLLQKGAPDNALAATLSAGGAATLVADVDTLADRLGVMTPSSVSAELPFTLAGTITSILPQRAFPDVYPDHSAALLESFSTAGAEGHGAAVIALDHPVTTGLTAYFVPFGESPASAADHQAACFRAFLYGLRALHVAGAPRPLATVANHTPVVEFVTPDPDEILVNPSVLPLTWSTSFVRFDREPFTAAYPDPADEQEPDLYYVISYQNVANGLWFHAIDQTPATPGSPPDAILRRFADAGPGDESYLMVLSADNFPAGDYVARVDCFHASGELHPSHHELEFTVRRTTP